MEIINDRNIASHVYDEDAAEDLFTTITKNYYYQFNTFLEKMNSLEEATEEASKE